MAKSKYHYYVLVFTNSGPVYVTSIPERNFAKWDRNEKPDEFSKSMAEDIAMGLNLNGYSAQMVCSPVGVDTQPYWYEKGSFEWKVKEDHENND
jgi:hypothetical protein